MFKKLVLSITILCSLLVAPVVFGVGGEGAGAPQNLDTTIKKSLTDTVSNAGLSTTSSDPSVIIGRIINSILGLIGILLVLIVIYAGFLWMTAGGDSEKVKKSKQLLTNAVIGLIIVFSAYAITNFVVDALLKTQA